MKAIIHGTTWAALLAISLASGANLRAAEGKVKSQNDTLTGTNSSGLGQIERADKLIGKQIRGTSDEKLGKLDDFAVELTSGRILYAIVGSGGVLGAGEKRYAIPAELFTQIQDDIVRVNADQQKLKAAPEFTKDIEKSVEDGKTDFAKNVYTYFGQKAWFEDNKSHAPEGSFSNVQLASKLMGMKVVNSTDQPAGKVENLATDLPEARAVFVILSPDRSFDLGKNLYALPPNALTMSTDRKRLVSGDLTKEKLAAAPHFEKDSWPDFSNRSWVAQVYHYFGKQPYFDEMRPTGSEKERVYPQK